MVACDRGSGFEREATDEDCRPPEYSALILRQQVEAPVDVARSVWCRATRPDPAREQPEPIADAREDLLDRQRSDPRGGQLEGQRNAVEVIASCGFPGRARGRETKPGCCRWARSTNSCTASDAKTASGEGPEATAAAVGRPARPQPGAARDWWRRSSGARRRQQSVGKLSRTHRADVRNCRAPATARASRAGRTTSARPTGWLALLHRPPVQSSLGRAKDRDCTESTTHTPSRYASTTSSATCNASRVLPTADADEGHQSLARQQPLDLHQLALAADERRQWLRHIRALAALGHSPFGARSCAHRSDEPIACRASVSIQCSSPRTCPKDRRIAEISTAKLLSSTTAPATPHQ